MEPTTDVFRSQDLMNKHMSSRFFKKFLQDTQERPRTPEKVQWQASPSLNRSLQRAVSPETPEKPRKDYQQVVEQALRNYYEGQIADLRHTFREEMQFVLKEHQDTLDSKAASYSQLQQDYDRLKQEHRHLEEQLHTLEHRKLRQLRQHIEVR